MVSIDYFFDKRIVISRLSTVSGNRKALVSTGTIDAHIQRLDSEPDFKIYGVLGATHKAWVDISEDVQQGDNVRDPSGNIYTVVSVAERDFGMSQHLELILKIYEQ